MIRRTRSLRRTARAALLAAAGLVLAFPAAAADRDGRQRHRHERGDRHEHADRHEHGHRHHRHGHHREHFYRHPVFGHHPGQHRGPRYARGRHYRRDAYYCRACRHRFGSWGRFRTHIHHHHGVPLWRIPFVVFHGSFGWLIYG